jgi:maltooligosyltrehalose synthase
MGGAMSPPLGQQVWGDTKIVFPTALAGTFRDALSGQSARLEPEGDDRSLRVGEVLEKFPVAVLHS